MSTFNGVVKEFPLIRIDRFRSLPGHPPPLACFLSHVHSDHLVGLENFKAPFIYCTPATREVLLKIEKYPHRMNFAKGILERRKQTYCHLSKLLKTIPLEVPTKIDLGPGKQICVTLFDACHCVGACMFLLQDSLGTAVLYTGDIRCETWFVNSLVHNPLLVPYTLGPRRLDCMYLDTTFAADSDIYRWFPSKAEGLRELLQKISSYPSDTLFYLRSWTFGYEDVWVALAAALGSQVHLDSYKWRVYKSLAAVSGSSSPEPREAARLCGFRCGNHYIPGCLTSDENVRIHSCEKGSECQVVTSDSGAVHIIPIITRTKEGNEVFEPGAGGGLGDLSQIHELDLTDPTTVTQFMALCVTTVGDKGAAAKVIDFLTGKLETGEHRVRLDADGFAGLEDDELSIDKVIDVLQAAAKKSLEGHEEGRHPKTVTFPYSRHSSYSELCELVAAFKPRDIHPCTVDKSSWTDAVSMHALFGEHCSGDVFAHDRYMRQQLGLREGADAITDGLQATRVTAEDPDMFRSSQNAPSSLDSQRTESEIAEDDKAPASTGETLPTARSYLDYEIIDLTSEASSQVSGDLPRANIVPSSGSPPTSRPTKKRRSEYCTFDEESSTKKLGIGEWAYRSAAAMDGLSWDTFGGLESTREAGESQDL